MSEVILVPHRLNPDTPLPDNLSYMNDNFEKILQQMRDVISIDDFGTLTGFNNLTFDVSPSTNSINGFFVFTQSTDATIVGISPEFSIYVDTYSRDYLYPDGALLTSGQRAMVMATWALKTIPPNTSLQFGDFVGKFNGINLYMAGYIILQILNSDSTTHNYRVDYNAKVLNKKSSVFR